MVREFAWRRACGDHPQAGAVLLQVTRGSGKKPMELSPGEHAALSNLSRKKAGQDVDWISIADARALTERGLAERRPGGWQITAEGEASLATQDATAEDAPIAPHQPGET
jgi:hypothetical protein